ncbi:carboxypeptidase-like regulatory domain-containing protein [Bacteroides sp. ET489]|uniref:carboxypeptidase-like regulatory domain-containing protein n=1 Tax=Bacteroides sp. ET489 TaxID=3057126 RepID=UPI0026739A2A|nr:carboxypeptidase-like regulatory domain-containing protein [Bacteroides sp. ET489]MDO3391192.1 carboxypeptidase-like regulatory domain-containing protein [Bacteroides sp. ET489]
MKKFMNFGVLALLGMALTFGMTSCSDDDPDYSNVTPPTVELAKANISGMVTTIGGKPIEGARVSALMGSDMLTAMTDANGEYKLEGVKNGTYTMQAIADGKQTMSGSVTVADGETAAWNTRLSNEATTVSVSQTEETSVEVVTETLENNEEAQVTTVTVIPAAAVEEGEEIIVTPVYSTDYVATKAATTKDFMVMGINISCSNPNAVLKAPIKLTFDLTDDVIAQIKPMKEVNGNWVEAEVTEEGEKVVFTVDAFTTYSLFINATLNQNASTEAISFAQAEYDNLYGASEMSVGTATYTYKMGSEIGQHSNLLGAYLAEILAQQMAGSTVKTVNGSYEINVTLPIGTALTLSGKQAVETTSIAAGSTTVSGKSYGKVSVTANTYNRQHNGGTN